MDGVGNIVPINEIDVPLGTAMSFKFFVHQAWGLQCVSHFEIAADNFSSLSFEDITEEGAYDAVHWGITTSNVGATTLSFTNPECTLDPPDMPISASLGSGSVTYKILSNPANPGAGYQLYTAALGLQNINVFDEFGALIDKNNISFLPGTPISFAFYIGEAWQIQCVREYNITAQNLAGLAFAGIFPVQVYDAVSFDTAIAETGSTSLTYANPGCSI
jgi:hypothetical protein